MNDRWERAVPLYGHKVLTPFFKMLAVLALLAQFFVLYRETFGLGPATGLSDAYGWGIWKTFNIMVLTALGSGAFAVGFGVWVFNFKKQHSLMRMALLTSLLAYSCGLFLLGVDAGRPWNFYWILLPWNWNLHSPLAEVAICMSIYALIPLAIENLPPVLERYYYLRPKSRPVVQRIERVLEKYFPWIIGLAYALPMMHQSSLGALMLLAGTRVHPLWQTPWLPLLYVLAAMFMAYSCVAGTTMVCCLAYKRPLDMEVLSEAAILTSRLTIAWLAFQVLDIIFRGELGAAFGLNHFVLVFWAETLSLLAAVYCLLRSVKRQDAAMMFVGYVAAGFGGMIYRFAPPTLVFAPRPEAFYFPSFIEVMISLGFIALAAMGFMLAVKKLAILPAPRWAWYQMAEHARLAHPKVELVEYAPARIEAAAASSD